MGLSMSVADLLLTDQSNAGQREPVTATTWEFLVWGWNSNNRVDEIFPLLFLLSIRSVLYSLKEKAIY